MKYHRVLSYVRNAVWAIDTGKMDEILAVLAHRAAGHLFTADEIQARIGAGAETPSASQSGSIAIVPLRGTIAHRMGSMDESSGGMSAERFTAMIRTVVADPSIGTILLDVDSPGGTVPGVPEAADAVFAARETKKIIAIANSQMCSAAYWIASQAHEIVGLPSAYEGKIGSIGAFGVHQDISAALEKEGIKTTFISAGKYKTEGNPFEPLSAEALAVRQAQVDEAYSQFVKAVARGRGVTPAAVRGGFGEGRALSAKDAKAAGLIDRIGTMDETLARLSSAQGRSRVGMRAETGTLDDLNALINKLHVESAALIEELVGVDAAQDDEDRVRRFRHI